MGDVPLVVCTEGSAPQPEPGFWEQEPHFWAGRSPLLGAARGAGGSWLDRLADYLCHRIARFSGDVSAHSSRILLHLRRGDRDATYGALVDLFVGLGEHDRPYREHVLKRAAGVLSPQQHAALRRHLETGLTANDPLPSAPHSVLIRGLTGTTHLVVAATEAAESLLQNHVAQSRRLLAMGRAAEAKELLEKSLLDDPTNSEIGTELLEIYRITRDRSGPEALSRRLSDKSAEAAQTWAALAAMFSLE
jgi:hypothetical protein